jgi:hypothetical protein
LQKLSAAGLNFPKCRSRSLHQEDLPKHCNTPIFWRADRTVFSFVTGQSSRREVEEMAAAKGRAEGVYLGKLFLIFRQQFYYRTGQIEARNLETWIDTFFNRMPY